LFMRLSTPGIVYRLDISRKIGRCKESRLEIVVILEGIRYTSSEECWKNDRMLPVYETSDFAISGDEYIVWRHIRMAQNSKV